MPETLDQVSDACAPAWEETESHARFQEITPERGCNRHAVKHRVDRDAGRARVHAVECRAPSRFPRRLGSTSSTLGASASASAPGVTEISLIVNQQSRCAQCGCLIVSQWRYALRRHSSMNAGAGLLARDKPNDVFIETQRKRSRFDIRDGRMSAVSQPQCVRSVGLESVAGMRFCSFGVHARRVTEQRSWSRHASRRAAPTKYRSMHDESLVHALPGVAYAATRSGRGYCAGRCTSVIADGSSSASRMCAAVISPGGARQLITAIAASVGPPRPVRCSFFRSLLTVGSPRHSRSATSDAVRERPGWLARAPG